MREIDPKSAPLTQIFNLITGGIAPRPIALVSTVSEEGIDNLAPFSFFNAFGANPPIVAFSPARRSRDGTTKDTYNNLMENQECVIQVVTYDIVHQVNLASEEFDKNISEFKKSGLTPIPSQRVKPKRVKESPFQMECKLQQMIPLGEKKGSGNLAICEVLLFHVAEDLLEDDQIHPDRIRLVGRNGGSFYTKATGSAIFELPKP